MYNNFIEKVYSKSPELKKFKDYHVMIINESIINILNTEKSR